MVETAIFGFFHRPQVAVSQPNDVPLETTPDFSTKPVAIPSTAPPAHAPEPAVSQTNPLVEPDRPVLEGQPLLVLSKHSANVVSDADQVDMKETSATSPVVTSPEIKAFELDASRAESCLPQSAFCPTRVQVQNLRLGLSAGTRVLTARGEVEVELIAPGDLVLALRGPSLLTVLWVGNGHPADAPIWIEAGALGRDLPRRPLCLGPDHALFIEPEPVLARTLINGTTIRQARTAYPLFLIDVGNSDVLFAEGVPIASSERVRHAPAYIAPS